MKIEAELVDETPEITLKHDDGRLIEVMSLSDAEALTDSLKSSIRFLRQAMERKQALIKRQAGKVEQFKRDNPNASSMEVRAFMLGIKSMEDDLS